MNTPQQAGICKIAILVFALSLPAGCKNKKSETVRVAAKSTWPNKLDYVRYQLSTGVFGSATTLELDRSGCVTYSFSSKPHTGSGEETKTRQWRIPPEQAENTLDAFVEAGILDLTHENQMKFPSNRFSLLANGWQKTVVLNRSVPNEIWKLLLPLLIKADSSSWKKDSQPKVI